MAKRAHGAGTVTPYKDGFQLKWTDPVKGRQSRVIRPCTRRKAETELRAILADLDKGKTTVDERRGSMPFETFMAQWMELKETEVKHSTFMVMRSQMKTMVLPTFGKMPLNSITRHSVDLWWARHADRPVNRRNAYFHLRGVFDYAMKWDILEASPCRVKEPGKDVSKNRPDWSVEDFDTVLAHVDPFYVPAFEVMFAGHFRVGELVALNGSDVRGGFVSATKQRSAFGYTSDVKNGVHATVELLERGRRALASMPAVIGDAPLFRGERAERMPRRSLQDAWSMACEAAGYKNFHAHDIRHIGLSLVAESGVDRKIVQQRARHGSPSSTDRYIHTSKRQHADAVQRVDEMLRSAR